MFIDIRSVSLELVGKGEKGEKILQKSVRKVVSTRVSLLPVPVTFSAHLNRLLAERLAKINVLNELLYILLSILVLSVDYSNSRQQQYIQSFIPKY